MYVVQVLPGVVLLLTEPLDVWNCRQRVILDSTRECRGYKFRRYAQSERDDKINHKPGRPNICPGTYISRQQRRCDHLKRNIPTIHRARQSG